MQMEMQIREMGAWGVQVEEEKFRVTTNESTSYLLTEKPFHILLLEQSTSRETNQLPRDYKREIAE